MSPPPQNDVDWGSVGEWVSGVATAIAVVTAFVFSLRSDRARDEAKLDAVFAWFVLGREGADRSAELWLHNATDLPVYRWLVTMSWTTDVGEFVRLSTGSDQHGVLPPGRYSFDVMGAGSLPENDTTVQLELRFTDARRRARLRMPSGNLINDRTRRPD